MISRFHARAAALALGFALAPLAVQAQQNPPPRLPDGQGKELVEAMCTTCHQTNQIVGSSGYTQAQWKELIGTMIDLAHVPDQRETITQYLAANFPPNTRRAPKAMPGNVRVTFKDWQVPTLGQRSRDPVEAPDGSIWWAGQFGNVVGRIDPRTGDMKEYALPARALPHTVNVGPDGMVWYSGNGNGTIGKLDPATGKITEYKMPDAAARDPHTMEFDKNGTLWFTLQQSNMVGRLTPSTGEVQLQTMPIARSNPYGIKIDARGQPVFACNGGGGCLVTVDPKLFTLNVTQLPTPGTTVRRLDIAEDGMVWFVNSAQGKLGRFNPATNEIKEWDSPSGRASHPYAIAITKGAVWYNESGMRPDMLVRFEPKAESFQSWPIPSGGVHAGIIRHMRTNRDGNILAHQSSTNRIMLIEIH